MPRDKYIKEHLIELKKVKKGDWLFTCSMKPKQFNEWDRFKKREEYGKMSDIKWEQFSKYDDFTTTEGSSHAVYGCSLKPISEEYAKWFIKNECWKIYDELKDNIGENDIWGAYEVEIKKLCKLDNVKYEGY